MIPDEAVAAALVRLCAAPIVQELMRAALEAAAPHMLAEAKADAWQEGVEAESDRGRWGDYAANPYRSGR